MRPRENAPGIRGSYAYPNPREELGGLSGGGGGNRTRVRKVSAVSLYARSRQFEFRPGSRPPAGLPPRLVRFNLAATASGQKEMAASPLHGAPALSRGQGEAGRSLAFKQREPAQCRLVYFATLITGPSGVPGAQLRLQSLPSNPSRPHIVIATGRQPGFARLDILYLINATMA